MIRIFKLISSEKLNKRGTFAFMIGHPQGSTVQKQCVGSSSIAGKCGPECWLIVA